jgi:hypothetical protein
MCLALLLWSFWFCENKIVTFPFSLFPPQHRKMLTSALDIESEPPPEPAPPELFLPSHRDISMASINAITIKQPSNFVLKIDKNGDQIHEEFIPQSQHGKFKRPLGMKYGNWENDNLIGYILTWINF